VARRERSQPSRSNTTDGISPTRATSRGPQPQGNGLVRAGINQFSPNANWTNGAPGRIFLNSSMIELVSFKAGAIAGPARRGGPPPLRRLFDGAQRGQRADCQPAAGG